MKGNVIVLTGQNKLGNYVYYKRGGIQMARAYQPQVANPKTASQIKARAKFGAMSILGKAMSAPLALGFKEYDDTRVSARNCFAKTNQDALAVSSSGAVQVDFESLIIAKGSGAPVEFGTPDATTAGKIIVPITDNMIGYPGALLTDRVVVALYCPAMGFAVMSGATMTREKNSIDVIYPSRWSTSKIHVYGFTYQEGANGIKVSNSEYLGEFTAA